tara:strand:+ start:82 stop:1071 length:990 start_codon:yes stop_codon:yes gene_type:complete
MKKAKVILFTTVCLISIYYNYKVNQSYKLQTKVVTEFNAREYSKETYLKFLQLDISYPNLSATGFPMYALAVKYKIEFNEYDSALKMLQNSEITNPYLRVRESLKAEVYRNLGVNDSAFYFSKKAFENLPMNARHFEQYIKELVLLKNYEEIKKIFRESNAKHNFQYWQFYFAALINKNDKEVDSFAEIAIKKFPNNDELKTIASFTLNGMENTKESYKLYTEGIQSFKNHRYSEAAEKFIKAHDLNPQDYSFLENAGMALIKNEKYQEAIYYLDKVISNKSSKEGKSEFGLGVCYEKLNKKEMSCKYYNSSMKLDYKPAFVKFAKNCG